MQVGSLVFAAATLACCDGAIDDVTQEAWDALSRDQKRPYYKRATKAIAAAKQEARFTEIGRSVTRFMMSTSP